MDVNGTVVVVVGVVDDEVVPVEVVVVVVDVSDPLVTVVVTVVPVVDVVVDVLVVPVVSTHAKRLAVRTKTKRKRIRLIHRFDFTFRLLNHHFFKHQTFDMIFHFHCNAIPRVLQWIFQKISNV
jgi:hypothetical protein